jgi:polar amino acid transport system substrate-binding protein
MNRDKADRMTIDGRFCRWLLLLTSVFSSVALCRPLEPLPIVTTPFPPYQMEVEGEATGISTEIVQAIMAEAGIDYRIRFYPWSRAYLLAQQPVPTLIYNLGRTRERETQFQWIGAITPHIVYLWRRADRDDIRLTHLADAARYRIGVLKNDVKRSYLLEQQIPESQLPLVPRDEQNVQKLMRGRIDLMPYDEGAFIYHLNELGYQSEQVSKALWLKDISGELYLAASLSTPPALVERLQLGWKMVREKGIYHQILARHHLVATPRQASP